MGDARVCRGVQPNSKLRLYISWIELLWGKKMRVTGKDLPLRDLPSGIISLCISPRGLASFCWSDNDDLKQEIVDCIMFWRGYRCIERNAGGGDWLWNIDLYCRSYISHENPFTSRLHLASRQTRADEMELIGSFRDCTQRFASETFPVYFPVLSCPPVFSHTFRFQLINDLPLIMLPYKTVSDTKSRIGEPSSNSGLTCYIHSRTNGERSGRPLLSAMY